MLDLFKDYIVDILKKARLYNENISVPQCQVEVSVW